MSGTSRKERRDALKQSRLYYSIWLRRFIAFAHNSVKFENLGDTPKRYIMKVLINYGAIAYDKQTRLFLRFVQEGYDVYGLPERYTLYGYNGLTLSRSPDEVVILRINDLQEPIKPYLTLKANRITDFDMAIMQNLEAIKTMTIYECNSDGQALSLVNQAESRRIGATMFFANKNTFKDTNIKVANTGAQYLVDKLQIAKQREINEALSSLGMAVANTDRKERENDLEVNSLLSYSKDCLYLNIDTFNYDAKQGGLDIRMVANTSTDELWEVKNEKNIPKNNNDNKEDNSQN